MVARSRARSLLDNQPCVNPRRSLSATYEQGSEGPRDEEEDDGWDDDCICRKQHGLAVNEPVVLKACYPVLINADSIMTPCFLLPTQVVYSHGAYFRGPAMFLVHRLAICGPLQTQ